MSETHDEDLSRLYREGPQPAPPPALDRSVLEAAARALRPVAQTPRRSRRRWQIPVAAFATILVTAFLALLQIERSPMPEPQTRPAARGAREPAPPSSPADARKTPPVKGAARPHVMVPHGPTADVFPSAPVPAGQEGSPTAEAPTSGGVSAETAAQALAPRAASKAAPSGAPVLEDSMAPRLEEIRRLRREGRAAEAAAALAEFRRSYPEFPLPPDLAAP